uniref:ATP synthase subunit a, chloroplastic n=1 Tax=Nitzschia sp. NIES-3576 TaxID=2083273 RepID=A0A2Z5ZAY1_9STRA|nr:ATP synthase CF0 A chain subunit IV [Nitzschia sp. NIES-3576]
MFLAQVEVGTHLYWKFAGYLIHGQVFLVTWFIIINLILASLFLIFNIKNVPSKFQMILEFNLDFIKDIIKSYLKKNYNKTYISFIGTLFLYILLCNWSGSLIPWKLIKIKRGELSAPTNNLNTTSVLALIVSFSYFCIGITKKQLKFFNHYIKPIPLFLPFNLIEDITKPLSLSFRLFGNILADELTISVLTSLIPLFIPLPIMLLGFFTGSVQALIFATLATSYISEAI